MHAMLFYVSKEIYKDRNRQFTNRTWLYLFTVFQYKCRKAYVYIFHFLVASYNVMYFQYDIVAE